VQISLTTPTGARIVSSCFQGAACSLIARSEHSAGCDLGQELVGVGLSDAAVTALIRRAEFAQLPAA